MKQPHLLFLLLAVSLLACKKETIQMDNLSTDVKVPHQIAIPLLQTSMVFEEVAGRQADSIIEYRGDSILLFFPADFSLRDTMEIPKTGQNLRFEHFYLYHGIQNMFPIGLDIDLVLRNDDLNVNLDTFSLKGKDADVDVPFIEPAPVGSNNLVDESAVHEKEGYLALDSTFFNQYYGDATHLIIVFTLQQTADTLRILDHYNMDIRLSIDASGYYIREETADSTQTTTP